MTKRSICYGVAVGIVTLLIVGLTLAQTNNPASSPNQNHAASREAHSGMSTGKRQYSPTLQTVNAKNSAHATESMSTQSQASESQGTNSRFYCGDPDRPMEVKQDFGQVQASKRSVAASADQTGKASGGAQATNPLYQENGKSGTNPLYESGKLTDAKTNSSTSGTEDITTRKAGVKQDMGPDHIAKKHIAGVKYEDRTAAGSNSSSSQGTPNSGKP